MAGLSKRRNNSNPFLSNETQLPETQSPEEIRKTRNQKILRKLCYLAPIALLGVLIIAPPRDLSFQSIQQHYSQGSIDPVSSFRRLHVLLFRLGYRLSGMKSGVFQESFVCFSHFSRVAICRVLPCGIRKLHDANVCQVDVDLLLRCQPNKIQADDVLISSLWPAYCNLRQIELQ